MKRNFKPALLVLALAAILITTGHVLVTAKDTPSTDNQTPTSHAAVAYDAYAAIPENDINRTVSIVEYYIGGDSDDPYNFYNNSQIVALVHVDSIDGGRTYDEISKEYIHPYTYGKLTVLESYKGDIKSGQQLPYSRLGGIVTYDEWYKSLNKEEKSKHDFLTKGVRPDQNYIEDMFMDDIRIEAGKTYVVFMQLESSQDGKLKDYVISGIQYGLREVKGYDGKDSSSISVLNNDTGKWESLDKLIPLK